MGRPGLRAVRDWPTDVLAEALIVAEADAAARRYADLRRIAEGSMR